MASLERKNLPGLVYLIVLYGYFLGQIVYYFSASQFFGQGITYLINFLEMSLSDYVYFYLINFSYYPPFYYAWLMIPRLIFEYSYMHYVLISSSLVLAGSVYTGLLLRRFIGTNAAYLGVTIFLLAPGTTIFSKALIIEAPLMFFIPAIFYHLAASEGFSRRGHCLALGLLTGLGLLTKWTIIVYSGFGFLFAAIAAIADLRKGQMKSLQVWQAVNMLLVVLLLLIIAGPWYLLVFDYQTFQASAANDPLYLEYNYLQQVEYCLNLMTISMGKVWGPVALVIGLTALLFSYRRWSILAGYLGLVLAPFLVFAIPVHLEDRYLYPLIPAVALLLPLALYTIRSKWIRLPAVTVLAAVLLYNHAVVYYPIEKDMYRDDDPVIHRWGKLFWGQARTQDILEKINHYSAEAKLNRKMVIAPHPLWTSYHCNFVYMVYFLKTDPELAGRFEINRHTKFGYSDYSRGLEDFDFLIFDEGIRRSYLEPETDQTKQYFEALASRGYIDQNTGAQMEKYATTDVLRDFVRIYENFREIKSFSFEGAYNVKVFVNRKLDDQLKNLGKDAAAPEAAAAHNTATQPIPAVGEGL